MDKTENSYRAKLSKLVYSKKLKSITAKEFEKFRSELSNAV